MTRKGKKALARSVSAVAGLLGSALVLEAFLDRGDYKPRERLTMGGVGVALVAGATTLEVVTQ